MTASSTSSSPVAEERLLRVGLGQLYAHPSNSNLMADERLDKLARNIEREGRYPPLIVRPHPHEALAFEVLDGHRRLSGLRRLGYDQALCYIRPCDDATALVLLATLNRLEGEDVPARRSALLAELACLLPKEDLALLLPESAAAIDETLAFGSLDAAAFLAELTAKTEDEARSGPRFISFAVAAADEGVIEAAITAASAGLSGPNRRGRALTLICRHYLEEGHNG